MPAGSSLTCVDWRTLSASEIRPLLEHEAARWRRELDWDVRNSWRVIEPARAAGALPGIVVRDHSGRIAGWTWFLSHRGCLQVAALVSDDAATTASLVAAVQASEAAGSSTRQVWSVPGEPDGLQEALVSAGLGVERYLYLRAALQLVGPAPSDADVSGVRPWTGGDVSAVARLLPRAYASDHTVRAFAAENTPEAWESYLRTLIDTDGCGTLLPEATLVHESSGRMTGAIFCGAINREPKVAHISQIVVDPDVRRGGVGRRLVETASARCTAAGFTAMTLLVAERNHAARRLYGSLGFVETGRFTVGSNATVR